MLERFKDYIDEFSPSAKPAKSFISRYSNYKPRTLYRYIIILKPFMKWGGDPVYGIKIPRYPGPFPQSRTG
jgi:hypothetical protein